MQVGFDLQEDNRGELCPTHPSPILITQGLLTVLAIVEVIITNIDVSRLFLHANEYAVIHRLNLVLSTCSIFITGLSTLLMQMCFVWRGYVLWNKPRWFLPVFGFLTLAMFFSVTFVFSV